METFCLVDHTEETQIWHLNVYILLAFSSCFLYLNENVLPCGPIRGDTDLTFICIGFNIYHSSSQGNQAVKALKHSIASIVHICTCSPLWDIWFNGITIDFSFKIEWVRAIWNFLRSQFFLTHSVYLQLQLYLLLQLLMVPLQLLIVGLQLLSDEEI